MSAPTWLDVRAAASRLSVSTATILRAARSGALKGNKLGGKRWRFRTVDLDNWMGSNAAGTLTVQENLRGKSQDRCSVCGSNDLHIWYRGEQSTGGTCRACGHMFITVLA
jgi:excisionase family DNA binding protein